MKQGMRTCDECEGTKLWAPYGTSEPERETCCMCDGTGEIEDDCYCAARYSGECACNYTGWNE